LEPAGVYEDTGALNVVSVDSYFALPATVLYKVVLVDIRGILTEEGFADVDTNGNKRISEKEYNSFIAEGSQSSVVFRERGLHPLNTTEDELLNQLVTGKTGALEAACKKLNNLTESQSTGADGCKDAASARITTKMATTVRADVVVRATLTADGAGASAGTSGTSDSDNTVSIVIVVIVLLVILFGGVAYIFIRKRNMDMQSDNAMSTYANPTYAAPGATGAPQAGLGLPGAPAAAAAPEGGAKLVRQESLC